jgi:hypothetical protein
MARLNLILTTNAGKLQLRNIQASVIRDETLEDLILGRPLLESIGLDLNKHLVELTKENLVLDCLDDVYVNKGKVSMLISDQAVDDDIQAAQLDDNIFEIGEDANTEISEAFSLMVTKAIAEGLPEEFIAPMRSLLEEFKDIWRLRLGPDPPVSVEPMKIVLKENCKPVMCKTRRYPPNHREYMRTHVNELVQFGLICPNQNSSWASPPLIVHKPNTTTNFRMTIDVRRVNEQIEPTAWPMPNLEVVMQSLENSAFYASFDLFKGYWQFPLHEDSQQCLSFMTDMGIFTPIWVIQGFTGAVAYCQSSIQRIVGDQLYKELLV